MDEFELGIFAIGVVFVVSIFCLIAFSGNDQYINEGDIITITEDFDEDFHRTIHAPKGFPQNGKFYKVEDIHRSEVTLQGLPVYIDNKLGRWPLSGFIKVEVEKDENDN